MRDFLEGFEEAALSIPSNLNTRSSLEDDLGNFTSNIIELGLGYMLGLVKKEGESDEDFNLRIIKELSNNSLICGESLESLCDKLGVDRSKL